MIIVLSGCMGRSSPSLKPYDRISVADGEFLQYGKYVGGEKTVTINYVSRVISNGEDAVLINYIDGIRPNSTDRFPENYINYGYIKKISLKTGSMIEMLSDFSRMTNKDFHPDKSRQDPSRYFGEYYRHFVLKDNVMDMEIRTFSEGKDRDIRFREKMKSGYPVLDLDTAMLFAFRCLDCSKPGIFYTIVPAIIKEPLPVSFKIAGKERIKTALGEFDTIKLSIMLSDPFLGSLMDNYLKDSNLWIENSDRRLLIKMEAAGVRMEIENISNVAKKI